jgi:hypothetical protein
MRSLTRGSVLAASLLCGCMGPSQAGVDQQDEYSETDQADTNCLQGSACDDVVQQVIEQAFGDYADDAIRVAICESGEAGTRARNSSGHVGLFQMGLWERRRYGNSRCAAGQARAAAEYFFASGADWSPWECTPATDIENRCF